MHGSLGPAIDRRDVPWERYEELIGLPDAGASGKFPDFLVIAPPKTGTSWLHHNLVRHPGIYIPPAKEVRFFDLHWRSQNIAWYFSQFSAGQCRTVGDISPSYAFLPTFAIRLIRDLNPRLKLIVLMREPVARTWSHVRHVLVHGEPPFTRTRATVENVSHAKFVEAFLHDHTAIGNNYKDILSRWLQYFDRSQFHVEYIENAEKDPERYLREVFRFLDVAEDVSARTLPMRKRHNVGVRRALPAWAADALNEIYGQTRRDAEQYVFATFGRRSPWPPPDQHHPNCPTRIPLAIGADRRDSNGETPTSDERLMRILGGLIESWDFTRQSAPRLVTSRCKYDIYQWRDVAFGVPANGGGLSPRIKQPRDLLRYWRYGLIIRATVSEVEEQARLRQSDPLTRAAMNVFERLRATLARVKVLHLLRRQLFRRVAH
jgi:hypothetical protein